MSTLCVLVACDAGRPAGAPPVQSGPADGAAAASLLPAPSAAPSAAAPAMAPAPGRFDARSREIVNPDDGTMVLLYHDLAGLPPPIDLWVEDDVRVRAAPPIDKAARREAVRAELVAGLAAVRDVGRLRVSLADARLSDYDPAYGEFTVRALSPASELSFRAFGQRVATRFDNGQTAQIWPVPAVQAQAVRDKIGRQRVGLDVLLRVVDVQPGPGGGAIVTRIESFDLRAGDGSTLARPP